MTDSNARPALAEVQHQFAQWRNNRTGRRTPAALRSQAVALLKDHRISEICTALGISSQMIQDWRGKQPVDRTPRLSFVELPVATTTDVAPAREIDVPLTLTLQRTGADGDGWSITATLSRNEWLQAARLLKACQ